MSWGSVGKDMLLNPEPDPVWVSDFSSVSFFMLVKIPERKKVNKSKVEKRSQKTSYIRKLKREKLELLEN